jgi:hypothetical protein
MKYNLQSLIPNLQSLTPNPQLLITNSFLILPLILYFPVLSLPFFWDDVANFQHLFGKTILQVWIDSKGFPYYRPFTFTVWYAMQKIFGATNTVPFHALNLITLLALTWAVSKLARKLTRDSLVAFIAGALMGVFPFVALVVPLVASLFHLLVTLCAVLACLAILEFESTQQWRWAIIAITLSSVTPFVHESGVTVSALMAVCLFAAFLFRNVEPQRTQRAQSFLNNLFASFAPFAVKRSTIVVLIAFIFNVVAFLIWRSIPKDQGAFEWVGWDSIGQSIIFFLEGLTYPIQFVARWMMVQFGMKDVLAVAIVGIVGVVTLWMMARDWRWLLFGFAYCYVAAAPSIIALNFSYVTVSPRLMVYTAPASTILWAAAIVSLTRRLMSLRAAQPRGVSNPAQKIPRFARNDIGQTIIALLITALIVLIPIRHIQYEVQLHHVALDHLWTFVNAMKQDPKSKHLIVNEVNWIARPQLTYALGHEGVEVMPGYLNPQLMAWVHTQELYDVDGVTFELIKKDVQNLYYAPWGDHLDWEAMAARARKAERLWQVRYDENKIEFLELGRVAPASGEAIVSFADRIWLTAIKSGVKSDHVELRLSWRVNAQSGEDIFAHALDCEGNVLGQTDGASLGGVYPIWLWQAGESIHEIRRVPLSSTSSCYRIEIGLFDPKTAERTMAKDASGKRLENDMVLIDIGH